MAQSDKLQYLVQKYCHQDSTIQYVSYISEIDSFAVWQEKENYWKILSESKMKEEAFYWLMANTDREIRSSFVADFVKLTRWLITKKVDRINTPFISFNDKILDTTDFTFKEPSADIPSFLFQDYEYERTRMSTPVWDKFIEEILVDNNGTPDPDLLQYVYEVLGYMLVPEIAGQTMFYFVGAGANGKSTLLNLLVDIVGGEFVSSQSVEELTTKDFMLPNLIGKRLNVVNEEQSKYVQAEKFKALVSGDPVSARRLYGEPFTFVPTTKFIFASNHVPQFNDWDGGIERRVRIIPFNYNVPEEKRDTDLAKKLRAEIPGIVGKILDRGTKRVIDNGFKLVAPLQVIRMSEEFKKNTATLDTFITEALKPNNDPHEFKANSEIYYMYKTWAAQSGRKAVSSRKFFKKLSEIFPKCKSITQRHDGEVVRGRNIEFLDGNLYEI